MVPLFSFVLTPDYALSQLLSTIQPSTSSFTTLLHSTPIPYTPWFCTRRYFSLLHSSLASYAQLYSAPLDSAQFLPTPLQGKV
ncbi:unnamed protein product [Protopolystoma xenopodis]|uniref:Uncharacterized protein n=1 Tax=Protopolystoma xenopodis TaxID=117903 RepID=A0A3S5AZV5_9PLAT|nr:unnamed protein product [Protopolystoma xenopodis]